MNSIDRRVVEMEFDNKQFEEGVSQSTKSIDNLKDSLNFDDAEKSFNGLNRSIRGVDASVLSDALNSVTNKFSILGTIGDTVIRRITNAAMDCAAKIKNMAEAFTITPITTGMQEYETQINAIQTILSNTQDELEGKGYDYQGRIDLVNDSLDRLNHYADKTIYNFTQMTDNIGRFTAAGVDLETSVNSIQGVANLAAVSGATSEQASRAMLQLSQAISTGALKLQDWNSVVNAGMGGKVFQNALMRTAKAMGVTGKNAQKMFKKLEAGEVSFRESLSAGWITSEILTTTLEQISWDFEELARSSHLTEEEEVALTETLLKQGYKREEINELLAHGTELTVEQAKNIKKAQLLAQGYTQQEADEIIKLADNATEAATKVKTLSMLMDTLKEAAQSGWTQSWETIIGDYDESKNLWSDLSDHFGEIIGKSADARNALLTQWKEGGGRDSLMNALWNIIYSIENVVSVIKGGIQAIFPPATSETLLNLSSRFEQFTAKVKAFTEDEEKMGQIKDIVSGIASVFKIVGDTIKTVIKIAKQLFSYISPYGDDVLAWFADIGRKITAFQKQLEESGFFDNLVENVKNALDTVAEKLKPFLEKIKYILFGDGSGTDGTLLDRLKEWFSDTKDWLAGIKEAIEAGEWFQKLTEIFTKVKEKIKELILDENGKFDIASFIMLLLGGALIFSVVRLVMKVGSIVSKITESIVGIGESIKNVLETINFKRDKTAIKFMGIAAIFAAIGYAISSIAALPINNIVVATVAVGLLMTFSLAMIRQLGEIGQDYKGNVLETAASLTAVAFAMSQFAKAISAVGSLPVDQIIYGVAGIGAIMLECIAFLNLTKNAKIGIKDAVGLIGLAVSMILFAEALKKVGSIDAYGIVKGIVGLGLVMLEIVGFMKLTKKLRIGIKRVAGLIALAYSMTLFAEAIKTLGNMNLGACVQGVVALEVVLLELVSFMALTKTLSVGIKNMLGLAALGYALKLFCESIDFLGKMNIWKLVQGAVALGALLLEMSMFLALTRGAQMSFRNGAALVLMALSMKLFVSTLDFLGTLKVGTLVQGIVGLGLVLLEMAMFMALVKNAKVSVGQMFSMIEAGIAMQLFALAIKNIGELDTSAIVKGLIGLGVVMLEIVGFMQLTKWLKIGINQMSGLIIMGAALVLFAESIRILGKMPISAMLKGIIGLGLVMLELWGFMKLMSKFQAKNMAKSLLGMVALAIALGAFVVALKFVKDIPIETMVAFGGGFGAMLLSFAATLSLISKLPFSGIIVGIVKLTLIMGLITALMAVFGALEASLKVSMYIDRFGDLMFSLGQAIGKFIGGFVTGTFTNFGSVGEQLALFMTNAKPFFDNVKNIDESALTGVQALAGCIMQIAEANVVQAISDWIAGSNSMTTFTQDMKLLGTAIAKFAEIVDPIGKSQKSKMDAATEVIQGIVDIANALPREGGLVQLIAGAQDLGKFADHIPGLGKAMHAYCEAVGGLSKADADGMKRATDVARGISDLAKALPSSGGVAQFFAGAKDLGRFADDIPGLGRGLQAYATAVSGITEVSNSDFEKASTVATGIVELNNALPRSGGFAQLMAGSKDLAKLSGDMPGLGSSIKSYAKAVSGLDDVVTDSVIESARKAVEGIVMLANEIPSSGGLAQLLAGAKDIGDFAGDMPAVGKALKSYAKEISGFNLLTDGQVTNANLCLKGIVDLANVMPPSGGLAQFFAGARDLGEFSSDIPALGKALGAYATAISGGFTTINNTAVTNSVNAAKGIVDIVKAMPPAEGLAQYFEGARDLGEFSSDIPALGRALSTYAKSIGNGFTGVDPTAVSNSETAAKGIAAVLNALPPEGGFIDKIKGARSLAGFSNEIPAFGNALSTYSRSIQDFSAVDVQASDNAAAAAESIAKVLTALPADGGLWQRIAGAKNLGQFAEQVPLFGRSLVKYADSISEGFSGVDSAVLDTAADVALGLVNAATKLPADNGMWQLFAGAQSLGNFSTDVADFGEGLKSFAQSISNGFSGVDSATLQGSVDTATALAGIAKGLDKSNGWIQAITGSKDLGDFGSKCAKLGEGLGRFAAGITGVSIGETENATRAMEIINTFKDSLSTNGGVFNAIGKFFGGEQDLVKLSGDMALMAENLKIYSDTIKLVSVGDTSGIQQVITDLMAFQSTLEASGGVFETIGKWFSGDNSLVSLSEQLAKFAGSFSIFGEGIANAATVSANWDLVEAMLRSYKKYSDELKGENNLARDFAKLGGAISEGFTKGVGVGLTNSTDSVAGKVDSIGTKVKDRSYPKWKSVGENLGRGLAAGISAMAATVRNAAVSAASGAVGAIALTWQVHSPSRVAAGLGMNFDLGLAKGIETYAKNVYSSSEAVSRGAVEATDSILGTVSTTLAEGIDTTPTIRPILDMTDIQNGIGIMNGMFGAAQFGAGFFGGTGFLNGVSNMNFRDTKVIGEVNDKTIIERLDSLTDKFETLGDKIANMQIVLDSGTLVGETTSAIDRELGVAAMKKGRGN